MPRSKFDFFFKLHLDHHIASNFVLISNMIQWRYAYLLHFYDMIWYGICMLWYAIFMLCYEILKNDMIWYAIVWYGMVCCGML